MHVSLRRCVYHLVLRVGVGVHTRVRDSESESREGEGGIKGGREYGGRLTWYLTKYDSSVFECTTAVCFNL